MENKYNVDNTGVSCNDCIWGDMCSENTPCHHIQFLSEEYFQDVVLPRIRESITPRRERRLSRKVIKSSGVDYSGESLDSYYIAMINDCLSEIRKHRTAFIFNVDQIREVLSFEPDANIEINDGIFYVSLSM